MCFTRSHHTARLAIAHITQSQLYKYMKYENVFNLNELVACQFASKAYTNCEH